MEELKSLGVKTVMLTGDSHGAAKCAQDQVKLAIQALEKPLTLRPSDRAFVFAMIEISS